MEKLRDSYARETDPAKQKAIAAAVQNARSKPRNSAARQWYGPGASRANVNGWLKTPVAVMWNVDKADRDALAVILSEAKDLHARLHRPPSRRHRPGAHRGGGVDLHDAAAPPGDPAAVIAATTHLRPDRGDSREARPRTARSGSNSHLDRRHPARQFRRELLLQKTVAELIAQRVEPTVALATAR